MREKWIRGFEGKYSISDTGLVFSYVSGRKVALKASVNQDGYLCLNLGYGRKNKKSYKIHRLVAGAFIENPDGKLEVNHIDGNKQNNSAENLEWRTHEENMKHAFEMNLIPPPPKSVGELNGMSVLTESQVVLIKSLLHERERYGLSQSDIAKIFGISFQQVSRIKLGLRWKHIS